VDHAASGMGDVWKIEETDDADLTDVWDVPIVSGSDHPAPFHESIPERCIRATGATSILDPFTDAAATHRPGRLGDVLERVRPAWDGHELVVFDQPVRGFAAFPGAVVAGHPVGDVLESSVDAVAVRLPVADRAHSAPHRLARFWRMVRRSRSEVPPQIPKSP